VAGRQVEEFRTRGRNSSVNRHPAHTKSP
jgi:hypothetical protein